ncbi:MAG: hypothetical protein ACRBHB_11530 [Arenicella sp.]
MISIHLKNSITFLVCLLLLQTNTVLASNSDSLIGTGSIKTTIAADRYSLQHKQHNRIYSVQNKRYEPFNWFNSLFAMLLLIGSVMSITSCLTNPLSGSKRLINHSLCNKLAAINGLVGFILLCSGGLGLLLGLLPFSLSTSVLAVLSLLTGLVLSETNFLNKIDEFNPYIEKAQNLTVPVSLTAIVFSLLNLTEII